MDRKVSIIIPCRNEEKTIGKCLESVLSQDYPKENLEVLVIDGMSKDRTREIVKEYPFVKLIENKKKITPVALNLGIKESEGEVIIRMDAHAKYENDYIKKCVKYLKEYNADNVGGIIKTVPKSNTLTSKAIAISLSSSFGAGGSYFRIGAKEPVWVDTVFGGCYKREVFDRIGLFNESLVRSQDMELNLRLKSSGGRILLAPDIVAHYYPKDNLKDFFLHNIKDGVWAIYPLKFVRTPLKLRHYIPLIFVLTLPISIWPYIPLSFYFSFKTALKEKDARYFFIMPLIFFVRHFGYGIGSIGGLFKLLKIK